LKIGDNYNLPDKELLQPGNRRGGLMLWVPTETMIIIGKGSDPLLELISENIDADQIQVIRRGTGGCSVVLSPEMAVVSFVLQNDKGRKNSEYFQLFNSVILKALKRLGIEMAVQAGISDITINDCKIVGSSIYRNKDIVFYHAIINVAGSTDIMERYLTIPPRYPDYRRGRTHKDFVTSLKAQGYNLDLSRFEDALRAEWLMHFK